jgi:hypothetical protein
VRSFSPVLLRFSNHPFVHWLLTLAPTSENSADDTADFKHCSESFSIRCILPAASRAGKAAPVLIVNHFAKEHQNEAEHTRNTA